MSLTLPMPDFQDRLFQQYFLRDLYNTALSCIISYLTHIFQKLNDPPLVFSMEPFPNHQRKSANRNHIHHSYNLWLDPEVCHKLHFYKTTRKPITPTKTKIANTHNSSSTSNLEGKNIESNKINNCRASSARGQVTAVALPFSCLEQGSAGACQQ